MGKIKRRTTLRRSLILAALLIPASLLSFGLVHVSNIKNVFDELFGPSKSSASEHSIMSISDTYHACEDGVDTDQQCHAASGSSLPHLAASAKSGSEAVHSLDNLHAGKNVILGSNSTKSVHASLDKEVIAKSDSGRKITYESVTLNMANNALSRSSSANTINKPGITFVAYATNANKRFCNLVLSAWVHNITLTVFGWGDAWTGFGAKVELTAEYLKTLKDDDIVVLTDGHDALYQANADGIITRFQQFKKPIVYSAEKNCWPLTEVYCKAMPPSPLPRWAYGPHTELIYTYHDLNIPRFLNAGALLGYVKPLRLLFEDMAAESRETTKNGGKPDDQGIASMRYLSGKWDIELDFLMEMFMCFDHSKDDMVVEYAPDSTGKQVGVYRRHKITDKVPGILHFNGNAKDWFEQFSNDMWWSHPGAVDRKNIFFLTRDGRKIVWADACQGF